MKRIISFILTPVLVLSLCFPLAFAAPAPSPETETVGPLDVDAPRYAVYTLPYTINLDNNTYADLVFHMADKGGTFYFEDLVSISFHTTNPTGSHWGVVTYSYTIDENMFILYTTLRDMEGNTPSSNYHFDSTHTVFPSMVTGRSLSAEDEGVLLVPDSISVRFVGETENILPAEDGSVLLVPDSISVRFVSETGNILPVENGSVLLIPDSISIRHVG